MDLELHRVDYMQVEVIGRNCMKVLPNNDRQKKTLQKVVVADKNGAITCFGSKRREVAQINKMLPGGSISFVDLGGALGTPQDKIFVACGSIVHGLTKKGKIFLSFETNITENISCIHVNGSDLLVAGDYVYNHFSDCIDKGYYVSSDKINDIISIPLPHIRKEGELFRAILACNDKMLRVLEGTDLKCEIELGGIPSCIVPYVGTGGEDGNEVVYGTVDGKIGLIKIAKNGPMHVWEISNENNLGSITCLAHHDMSGNKSMDLLVGRDDGNIEVYSYDITDEPALRYSHSQSDSIMAIQGGSVGASGFQEVVAQTYSGWVIGLTTEPSIKSLGRNQKESAITSSESGQDRDTAIKIKSEIEELQMRVRSEKLKFSGKLSYTRVGSVHALNRCVLSPTDGNYNLSIELPTPIDHVVIQSDVPVDIPDISKSSAVVCHTNCISSHEPAPGGKPEINSGNFFLATYRCQPGCTRMELKVSSIEGQSGMLRLYVTPSLQSKICNLMEFTIKPLSLHQRSHFVHDSRPMNVLKLTGPFSLAEMHSWVSYSLPDVPERPPNGNEVTYKFVNTFLETNLNCSYKKGEGIFQSDNISTISILKDSLTKQATDRKITLNINYDLNSASIPHVLSLIHPKLEYQLMLAKKVQLIDALKELEVHEGSTNFLTPEYRMILAEDAMLREEFRKQPARLERLYGMVTDLFIDKFKFKGINVKQKVPLLLEVLDNYDLATLIEFFECGTN